jgi:predicted membrane-bound spermidine synthase
MLGLVAGSVFAARMPSGQKSRRRALLAAQGAMSVFPLIMLAVIIFLADIRIHGVFWAGSNIIFPALSAIAGSIGGFQFMMVNNVCFTGSDRIGGVVYGLDLLGSCLGALLTGAFLVPVIGITKTCFLISILNFSVLTLLISADLKSGFIDGRK